MAMSSPVAPEPMRLRPELEDLSRQFHDILSNTEELVTGLTFEQFHWRPKLSHWSIGECISHLIEVDRTDIPLIGDSIEAGHAQGVYRPGPYRYSLRSQWFIRQIEPPVSLRFRTAKRYDPVPNLLPSKVMSEFRDVNRRIQQLLERADGLDLARNSVPSPFSSWLHFPLGQRFRLVAAHDRRHLWQAWKVRRNPDFPASSKLL